MSEGRQRKYPHGFALSDKILYDLHPKCFISRVDVGGTERD